MNTDELKPFVPTEPMSVKRLFSHIDKIVNGNLMLFDAVNEIVTDKTPCTPANCRKLLDKVIKYETESAKHLCYVNLYRHAVELKAKPKTRRDANWGKKAD